MPDDILNALTVDVEDYFQVSVFERRIDRRSWHLYESRVVRNTERLLALFDRHGVRGTFFILGWVADQFPELVKSIDLAGHEIASHSYWHRLIYELTPEQFARDLTRSCDVLEQAIGKKVTGYRAPSFSVTCRSLWALPILAEQGIKIDSSIFPVMHDRYGIPTAPRFVHSRAADSWQLWEFPPSTTRLAGRNLPVGGGGYFRLFPLSWTIGCLRTINSRYGRPFMFYIHPWEVDPQQPRVHASNLIGRWRHRVNLHTTERKLDCLLREFRFGTVTESIAAYQLAAPVTTAAT